MKFKITNLENEIIHEFDAYVIQLSYNPETRRFSVSDFRMDEWMDLVCPRELEVTHSLFPELDGTFCFNTSAEADYFTHWITFDAVAAARRWGRAP